MTYHKAMTGSVALCLLMFSWNIPNLWSSSRLNRNENSIDLNIWSTSVEFEEIEENIRISLGNVNFAFMIPNPSLDCFYVVLNFWPNLSLVVLIKLFL